MNSAAKLTSVELRPDRKLLNTDFDSYKLSIKSLPCYQANVSDGVYQVVAGDDDLGYEKIRCLTLHNNLVIDPWYKEYVYYVDSNACIRRFHVLCETDIKPAKVVFSLGSEMTANKKLPPTFCFPSSTLCLICDGLGATYVLNTGSRTNENEDMWQIMYFNETKHNPCMVLQGISRNRTLNDDKKIEYLDVLLLKFEDKLVEVNKGNETYTEVVMEWIELQRESTEEFNKTNVKVFSGKSVPNYVALSPECSELHIASSSPFVFKANSDYKKEIDSNNSVSEDDESDCDSKDSSAPYKWKQSSEDISIFVELPPGTTSSSVVYSLTSKKLNIGIRKNKGEEPMTVLSGNLFLDADPESSNWSITEGCLEVTIQKRIEGRTWITVVDGDDVGEFLVDPDEAAKIHEKLAHLTSETLETDDKPDGGALFNSGQLEDCDIHFDSTATLTRFDATEGKFTHVADISSLRWLFNCTLSPTECPALVLRHDVDAIVWQPTAISSRSNDKHMWKHIDTFNALGYVHASKTNLKFCSSPPDTSYTAFCECRKRIFIYRQPSPLSTTLRNRSSGKVVKKVAVQQVATIDSNEDILGFAVSNEQMYILTRSHLFVFRVTVDDGA